MDPVIVAVISGLASLVVASATIQLSSRQQRRTTQLAERHGINATHLNPLRFQLADNHFRIWDILRRPAVRERMTVISSPQELSDKDAEWFNGTGNYLAASLYLAACMFASLNKLRGETPYLRLSSNDDTRLLELVLRLQIAFLKEDGLQYANQTSIGESMWLQAEERMRTYREFCEYIRNPESRVWIDRLIAFYVDTGQERKKNRALKAAHAIQELATFLDECVGGGGSVSSRWAAEGLSPPSAEEYDTRGAR